MRLSPRRSLFWKVYLSYAALVLVCAVAIGTLVQGRLRATSMRDAEARLASLARLLASMEAANPAHLWSAQLPAQIEEVARETGLDLTLLFANGTVAAESPHPVADRGGRPVGEILQQPEFAAVRRASSGVAVREVGSGRGPSLLVAAPILLDYEMIGYVRVGLPLKRLEEREQEIGGRVLAGTSLASLAALALGFVFTRHTTRPLRRISEVCADIAAGRLDRRVAVDRQDEIGVVAGTLNRMAEEVQRRIVAETRERQRLSTLLSAMADGVVAVGARGQVAYLNGVAARLLGLDAVQADGREFESLVRGGSVADIYREAARTGERIRREVRVTGHPEDEVLHVDAAPLRDPEGNPFGVLLVLQHLTELRRLEGIRKTFTANVSHELRTPLTAIRAIVEALIDDPDMESAERSRFLARIGEQNDRLMQLVQDLLMISRLEADREVLEKRPVDLATLAEECMETFAEVAAQKPVKLALAPAAVPVEVEGNVEALRLVLNNLVLNAVQHTPAGGEVEVAVGSAGAEAVVTVTDTGTGIAPEHLERIFERFYRVDRARSRGPGGAGLGLSIVKHLTQAHGGRVLVESRVGEGTRFTVRLPRSVRE